MTLLRWIAANRKKTLLTAVVLIAVLGGITWEIVRVREPVYQGKPLTYWLERYTCSPEISPITPVDEWSEMVEKAQRESETAILALGTNAIPHLLKLAAESDHNGKIEQTLMSGFVNRMAYRLGLWSKYDIYVMKGYLRKPRDDRKLSAMGFQVLGPVAKPAIPELLRLLETGDSGIRVIAAFSLAHVVGNAEQVQAAFKKHALSDPDKGVRHDCAVYAESLNVVPASNSEFQPE
ncbi:MAG: hypothetical protein C5B50_22245 [Verrucomicrobia bacterium]|nr:MAG: hypothetical protein C5B50_22245 [Verrucomicrobiota bacterium]